MSIETPNSSGVQARPYHSSGKFLFTPVHLVWRSMFPMPTCLRDPCLFYPLDSEVFVSLFISKKVCFILTPIIGPMECVTCPTRNRSRLLPQLLNRYWRHSKWNTPPEGTHLRTRARAYTITYVCTGDGLLFGFHLKRVINLHHVFKFTWRS